MSQEEKLPKILIVEDDERLARLTQEYLIRNGLEVGVEPDGNRAIRRIIAEQPDMVLLDVMLPGADGLTICREVRPHYHQPILMLTARTEDMDQVLGLEMGADDYVTKPFGNRELIARVKANLRRSDIAPVTNNEKDGNNQVYGDLNIDFDRYEVTKRGEVINLTLREFELLTFLATQTPTIFTRENLLEKVWGYEYFGDVRAVDVTIRRLREKIEDDPSKPKYIVTKRGVGYYFNC